MADPTTGDLYKAKTITEDEILAAIDVFMKDATTNLFRFASGHSLDLTAAVKGHEWARATVSHPEATDHLRRAAVRTAILLARPPAP